MKYLYFFLLLFVEFSFANTLSVPIKQNMPYSQARQLLLDAGWQYYAHRAPNGMPVCYNADISDDMDNCEYYEIDACSGTGVGFCKMIFFDGFNNNYLIVITQGGEPTKNNPAFIDGWLIVDHLDEY